MKKKTKNGLQKEFLLSFKSSILNNLQKRETITVSLFL